jgi:hypothetical protein
MDSVNNIKNYSLYNTLIDYIKFRDFDAISKDSLDDIVQFEALNFKEQFINLSPQEKILLKAKIKLNGAVNSHHLEFGKIVIDTKKSTDIIYPLDFFKSLYYRYLESNLLKQIYSIIEEDENNYALDTQLIESLNEFKARIITIENKAIPAIKMDFVFEQLKSLTHTIPPINEQYLSHEEFERFIRIGFGLEDLQKVTANIPRNHQRRFIREFHALFDLSCRKYSIPNRMEPFISIIERSFSNFSRKQIIQNMRSN